MPVRLVAQMLCWFVGVVMLLMLLTKCLLQNWANNLDYLMHGMRVQPKLLLPDFSTATVAVQVIWFM